MFSGTILICQNLDYKSKAKTIETSLDESKHLLPAALEKHLEHVYKFKGL
jgi:hypothetical protein